MRLSELGVKDFASLYENRGSPSKVTLPPTLGVMSGVNDHHKAEALFKALARALDAATRIDPRLGKSVPSTKGVIER